MKTLKQRLADGDIVFGGIVAEYLRPSIIKSYVNAGFDFIFVENEHASFNYERLADFVLCARDNGMTVVAKLGELQRTETARLLEMGVMGFQLPRTETPQEMTSLHDYIKFPPTGSRASATGYGNTMYAKIDKNVWYQQTNDETLLICHIETKQGVENIEPILDVPGIDICFIGASDLSLTYGKPGQYDDPDFLATMQHVYDTSKKQGIVRGGVANDYESACRWIDRGVTYFECATDIDLMRSATAKAFEGLQRARDRA